MILQSTVSATQPRANDKNRHRSRAVRAWRSPTASNTRGFRYYLGDRRQNTTEDPLRTRRTPGYRHIDRDHIGHAAATGVALTEDSTRATAVADGNDELRVRRGIVSAPQRHLHIFGNGSRNQQQICVPRTCYKPDTLA